MGRDPENGKLLEPATNHRYNYVETDPVNRMDPTGRADLLEYSAKTFDFYNGVISPAMGAHDFVKCAKNALDEVAADVNAVVQGEPLPYSSGDIFKDASECESEGLANIIKIALGLTFLSSANVFLLLARLTCYVNSQSGAWLVAIYFLLKAIESLSPW